MPLEHMSLQTKQFEHTQFQSNLRIVFFSIGKAFKNKKFICVLLRLFHVFLNFSKN